MSGKDLIGDVLSHGLTAIVDETIDYMPRNVLHHSDTVRKIMQFNAVKTLKYGHLQRTLGSIKDYISKAQYLLSLCRAVWMCGWQVIFRSQTL